MRAHANVISRVCTIDKIQTRRSGKRGPACPVVAVATAEREVSSDAVDSRVDVERIASLVDDSERTKEPVVHDGTRDDDDDDGETRVLSQRRGDRTCSAANSRQGHTRLTLARCVAREDEVASRRRASEGARRRESEEYEGKSRRERDKTKRGKKYESDKGKRKKTSLDLFLIDC